MDEAPPGPFDAELVLPVDRTAIDVDDLTGDIRSRITDQKHNHVGYFFRFTEAFERDLRQYPFAPVREYPVRHASQNDTGRNTIDDGIGCEPF